jgi:hypothetical protein
VRSSIRDRVWSQDLELFEDLPHGQGPGLSPPVATWTTRHISPNIEGGGDESAGSELTASVATETDILGDVESR